MPTPDVEFEAELEIFRSEGDACLQFFYAFLAVHAVAWDNRLAYRLLNEAALFWNTSLAALQGMIFIVLGRVFDQGSPHNVDRLLRLAPQHSEIFSRQALGARRQGMNETAPEWLGGYVLGAYEPRPDDFRRLRRHVRKWRQVYEARYRDLRRRVFAHRNVTERQHVDALFGRTNIREPQRMLVFLAALHDALWRLYANGRKPTLRPQRYSTQRIGDLTLLTWHSRSVQERITHEVEAFLMRSAGGIGRSAELWR